MAFRITKRKTKTMLKQILTTLSAVTMGILSSGCYSFNTHVFQQADKDSTGVLCIGMENSRFGNCPGARVDATRMHDLLKKNYSNHTTLLLSQQATKAVVIQKMQEVCKKDLAIIFYSGHGGDQKQSAATKLNWPEPTGKDQFLCLYDAALLDDEIWHIICGAKDRVVLICDCCHSGTMFRAPMTFEGKKVDEGLFGAGKEPNLWYLGGCIDNGYSYGNTDGGLMTNAFLERFKEGRKYSDMWRLLHFNKILNQSEQVQHTELGKSFSDYLIFR